MKKELIIRPEGWTDWIIFKEGFDMCGEAVDGLSVCVVKRLEERRNGGVMKNEDVKELRDALTEHLKAVKKL